jgi:hypothetical protein
MAVRALRRPDDLRRRSKQPSALGQSIERIESTRDAELQQIDDALSRAITQLAERSTTGKNWRESSFYRYFKKFAWTSHP